MARRNLPGRPLGGTGLTNWHRKLDCGCVVRFWPSRVETYFLCKQHQKASDEEWRKKPLYTKVLIYGFSFLFVGIPVIATILLFIYIAGALIYMLITGEKL